MAVYREGYKAIEEIIKRSLRIFPDSADYGAPTKKNDKLWLYAKQAVTDYGIEGTRVAHKYATGKSVENTIKLIDEWSVSDERKTIEQATEKFRISFVTCNEGNCKGFDGYLTVEKLTGK